MEMLLWECIKVTVLAPFLSSY